MDTSFIISDTLATILSKQSDYCGKCKSEKPTFEIDVIPKHSVEIKEDDDSIIKLLKTKYSTRPIIIFTCIICNSTKYFSDTDIDNNNFENDLKKYNDVKNIEYKHLRMLELK